MDIDDGCMPPSDMLTFETLHQVSRLSPRVGSLLHRGHPAIVTPTFVASTSRGIVPHISPDLHEKYTSISLAYAGLEDFIERSQRQNAPILEVAANPAVRGSALRAYTSLPDSCLSILGPRRLPSLDAPSSNSNDSLAISTSFGFSSLKVEDYDRATRQLRPDISVAAADIVKMNEVSKKRKEKLADRTHAWLRDTLYQAEKEEIDIPLFASIPPLESEQQSFYLADLTDEFKHRLSGVCIYERATILAVPDGLSKLCMLCFSEPMGPHDLLDAISLGVDLITVPFVTKTSEAGIALTFDFLTSSDGKDQPLGIDMWSPSHATDLSPLAVSCSCYACNRHHRAYVHHLLQAKEMLAWTLLQIHNYQVISQFFEQVRKSILRGSFDEDSRVFRDAYKTEIPQQTGLGPRLRGYQVKSVGRGELPKNEKAYNKFDDQTLKLKEAESGVATPDPEENAASLQNHGLGQKVD